jgi:hypothetical protein
MMTPYSSFDSIAPLPSAFDAVGVSWAKYVVSAGPLCGLTTTLLSCIFVFIRMTYAIADDGLLFSLFAKVNDCTKVPVMSCLIGGAIMSTIAIFMDIKKIISFTVLITLFQFLIVDACVIILRYRSEGGLMKPLEEKSDELPTKTKSNGHIKSKDKKLSVTYHIPELTLSDGDVEKPKLQDNEFDDASDDSESDEVVFEVENFPEGYLKPGVKKALDVLKCSQGSIVPLCVFLILVISFLGVLVLVYDHREVCILLFIENLWYTFINFID